MKTILALAFAAVSSLAFASSPAVIKDAGTNPAYFGSTANEVSTETGPVLGKPYLFRNGAGESSPK